MIQIVKCGPTDIASGGACAWQLPQDPTCARHARSIITATLAALALDTLAEAATLTVSELVTNALQHAAASTPIELWIWSRATPDPTLVIGVFDPCRTSWPQTTTGPAPSMARPHAANGAPLDATSPHPSNDRPSTNSRPPHPSGEGRPEAASGLPAGSVDDDLPDERGRGLGIVSTLTHTWGAHLTRSRVGAWRVPGKVVWAAFALPGPGPDVGRTMAPSAAAHYLADVLASRGVERVGRRDERGISLVSVPLGRAECVNVWIEPGFLSLTDTDGTRLHRPLIDLQDIAEHLVRRAEEYSVRSSMERSFPRGSSTGTP